MIALGEQVISLIMETLILLLTELAEAIVSTLESLTMANITLLVILQILLELGFNLVFLLVRLKE